MFQAVLDEIGNIRLKVQKLFDRLRTARLDDQRQPLGKDVIAQHHHGHSKKRFRRITDGAQYQADRPSGQPRECPELNQHVLIEDAAPQRHGGHAHNVLAHPEDKH